MTIASAKVDELAQRLARLTGEDVETPLESNPAAGPDAWIASSLRSSQ